MKARFRGRWAKASRANLALALTLLTTGSALAAPGRRGQRRACTPDVYRLCPGEIPNVRAIACAGPGIVRSRILLILANLSAET